MGISRGITRGITESGGGSSATQAPLITDAYDSDAVSTWQYGAGLLGDNLYFGIAGGTAQNWGVCAQKLNLAPGSYAFTELKAVIALATTSSVDRMAFIVYEKSGTSLIQVEYLELTPNTTGGTLTVTFDLGSLEVALESGKDYFFALAMRGKTGRTTNWPGFRRRNNDWASDESASFEYSATDDLPTTSTGLTFITTHQCAYQLTFTTKERIVYSGLPVKTLIPRRTDGYTTIKVDTFEGDATPTVIKLVDCDASSGVADRLVLDVDHTDEEITFGGSVHALTGQTGDTFDFLIQTNSTAAGLLYQNLTDGQGGEGALDLATISHHARENDTRGGSYTMAAATYRHMAVSGGGTIDIVKIGWEPIVAFGDSMSLVLTGAALSAAMTHPRITWRAGISGNRLSQTVSTFHTAGYLRYKHTTIGTGDLCEIRDSLFCFCMYGLNDISRINTGSATTATNEYFGYLHDILDDLKTNGNQPLVIGLAPYHHSVNTSTQEAQAIIDWIDYYAFLCAYKRVAWLTPWWDLVDRSTVNDDIPVMQPSYNDDGGTHINSTAAAVVAALASESYESGKVGGLWGKSTKRFRNG